MYSETIQVVLGFLEQLGIISVVGALHSLLYYSFTHFGQSSLTYTVRSPCLWDTASNSNDNIVRMQCPPGITMTPFFDPSFNPSIHPSAHSSVGLGHGLANDD